MCHASWLLTECVNPIMVRIKIRFGIPESHKIIALFKCKASQIYTLGPASHAVSVYHIMQLRIIVTSCGQVSGHTHCTQVSGHTHCPLEHAMLYTTGVKFQVWGFIRSHANLKRHLIITIIWSTINHHWIYFTCCTNVHLVMQSSLIVHVHTQFAHSAPINVWYWNKTSETDENNKNTACASQIDNQAEADVELVMSKQRIELMLGSWAEDQAKAHIKLHVKLLMSSPLLSIREHCLQGQADVIIHVMLVYMCPLSMSLSITWTFHTESPEC